MKEPLYRGCFSLTYACGLRISEAASLPVESIDSSRMLLSIVGKGDKERYVPLPNPVLQSPRRLWKTRRHPRWIFPNDSGKGHVPLRTLRRAFAAARREAGLSSSFTPHALRHGYATRLVENGVSIGTVQILLGHASIRSTAVYTHMTEPTQRKLRSLLDQIMADL